MIVNNINLSVTLTSVKICLSVGQNNQKKLQGFNVLEK